MQQFYVNTMRPFLKEFWENKNDGFAKPCFIFSLASTMIIMCHLANCNTLFTFNAKSMVQTMLAYELSLDYQEFAFARMCTQLLLLGAQNLYLRT